jgi:bifunctional N-acetylglucosamine-1-phosphate-uridyltransferase/glucosamine-1-phosphate-acetyltransferase GlmU-like protein
MKYQVTLFSNGQYKPVSAIVDTEQIDLTNKSQKIKVINAGIKKICVKRLWRSADLKRFGYNNAKIREYNPEELEQQKKDNYDLIKAIKYSTGEWKKGGN